MSQLPLCGWLLSSLLNKSYETVSPFFFSRPAENIPPPSPRPPYAVNGAIGFLSRPGDAGSNFPSPVLTMPIFKRRWFPSKAETLVTEGSGFGGWEARTPGNVSPKSATDIPPLSRGQRQEEFPRCCFVLFKKMLTVPLWVCKIRLFNPYLLICCYGWYVVS